MWTTIAKQLRHPLGALVGCLMEAFNRRSNQIAIEALGVEPDDTVLELGCGHGGGVERLARMTDAALVLGVDHSTTMLAHAARRNVRAIRERRVHFVLGRADALPCRSESFDKILAVHVLYFMGTEVIREARRVLRPGGKLSVLVTDRETMTAWKLAGAGIHRLYDQNDLAGLLREGGFRQQLSICRAQVGIGISGLLAIATKS